MHAPLDTQALYFSESRNALQGFAMATLCTAAVAMTFLLPFAIDPAASPRRRAWLEFVNQGNGWVGTAMLLLPALACGWWAARAIWRSDVSTPAVQIVGDQVVVHRSFLMPKAIPITALHPVAVARETAHIRALRLSWSDPNGRSRVLNIRSNVVRDGQLSLQFFAAALNAARNTD